MDKKILIADDHAGITDILSSYVRKEGYLPVIARDGMEALALYEKEKPVLLLLDVMMPGMDGLEVCREVRKRATTPVIMVTARSEDGDRILGLDTGADDYIVKPFSPGEVMARVRAVLRRVTPEEGGSSASVLKTGSLEIMPDSFTARTGGQTLSLTRKEFEILHLLAANPGRVFSRDHLLNAVWGYDYFGDARTVDTHIKRLRAKTEAVMHPDWEIRTIWGVGYKLEVLV